MGALLTSNDRHEHARQRARERYGLELTDQDIERIGAEIELGRLGCAEFIENQGGYRSLWLVGLNGKDAVVAYNERTHRVATFLPLLTCKTRRGTKLVAESRAFAQYREEAMRFHRTSHRRNARSKR